MKPVGTMTRLELAGLVSAEFHRHKINVVLSGGSCVSIYSQELYVSLDLDFVNIDELQTDAGILRIISPTDCVKDRLAWYYHDKDTECLRQAILVATRNDVDLKEVERWSMVEGKTREFGRIKAELEKKAV